MRGLRTVPRRFSKRAFQLVEVVLSLGISSFALLLILALIPLGLGVMQDSREDAATAEVLSHLHVEAQSLTGKDLAGEWASQRFYYDQLGREVAAPPHDATGEPAVYAAEVHPLLLSGSGLPGLNATTDIWALRVVISSVASGQEVLRQSFHLTPLE